MDFTGITSVVAITVICLLVGQVIKATGIDNKLIPVIVGVAGGFLEIAGMFIIPDFPAADYINAAAVGIVSGLASTGANQIYKQTKNTEGE